MSSLDESPSARAQAVSVLTSTPPANPSVPSMPGRTSRERGSTRFAPYPARERSLPRVSSSPPEPQQPTTPPPTQAQLHQPLPRVSSSTPEPQQPTTPPPTQAQLYQPLRRESSAPSEPQQPAMAPPTQEHLYQLLVRPIIKSTIGQRDTSGNTLADVVVNGGSISEIVQKLWEHFSPRVKCRAVKSGDVWSTEPPDVAQWDKVMQFKVKRHIVDSTKSEHGWNQWLVKPRGDTVILLVYEYGIAISRAQDLEAFKESCIRPQDTDRAGATAESALRDIVASLQEEWGATFQADAVVGRMWANHITRNLNRSTWEGRRMGENERHLEARKAIIEAFIRDMVPPPRSAVTDPMLELDNVDDFEHAD
ncbi:hypothetical protein PF010_g25575 [Phytophthora fragariae]|uniref:Uncharacterized protein n=1 Tax=Phytophthora fragariae TaxID=53985 RepID=A0A6A4BYJ2_9STRA|nr:hypothetical protein PF009_g18475 [Phytophthora fragariae]KAE8973844.1 hypothetical protein PF011_g25096 [Phytophthora fragariae]KAE9072210.1 hypothetical protein PF010_g25575 [Phytophthora fragariae]KAE9095210.1 hypothetical protein PF007_g17456 [Phytophthora fragariae]KAE9096411.1 hypothetical protein PF006_g23785 [Phytophthora fragariae]